MKRKSFERKPSTYELKKKLNVKEIANGWNKENKKIKNKENPSL